MSGTTGFLWPWRQRRHVYFLSPKYTKKIKWTRQSVCEYLQFHSRRQHFIAKLNDTCKLGKQIWTAITRSFLQNSTLTTLLVLAWTKEFYSWPAERMARDCQQSPQIVVRRLTNLIVAMRKCCIKIRTHERPIRRFPQELHSRGPFHQHFWGLFFHLFFKARTKTIQLLMFSS